MPPMLTRLCKATDVPEKTVKQVIPRGMDAEFAVYRLEGQFYATDDMCTHGFASLSQGNIDDGRIFCPLHGGAFDIRTGMATELPCRQALKTYVVVVIDDELFADLS
jgi:nitrite reductase/ring-hydroxylating ferredoxin subunit